MKRMFRYPAAAFCLSVLLLPALPAALSQPAQLSGGVFIRDRMLPEMLTYTMGGWRLRVEMGFARPDGSDLPHGAVVRFFVRNTSTQPLEVTGVWLEGVDLAKQIVPKHKEHGGTPSAGYLLNSEEDTPPDVRARLDSLGRPVWYQVRPDPVPPGAVAEVNIRLQAQPQQNRLRGPAERGGLDNGRADGAHGGRSGAAACGGELQSGHPAAVSVSAAVGRSGVPDPAGAAGRTDAAASCKCSRQQQRFSASCAGSSGSA